MPGEPDRPARHHAGHPQGIIAQVSHSSEELSGSADSIAQIAEQTAQFATSQQTSTQTMAAAIEELVVSISHL